MEGPPKGGTADAAAGAQTKDGSPLPEAKSTGLDAGIVCIWLWEILVRVVLVIFL
jgi:hypothetical protein